MNDNILGERLKVLRVENNLTQEEFGTPYNLRKSTISQYESGTSRPDDELKMRIAFDYNVSLDWLFGISDIRNSKDVLIKDLGENEIKEVIDFIGYLKYKRNKG